MNGALVARRDRLVRALERRRFVITTDTDETFDGVLTDWDDVFFVYEDVWSIAANNDRLHLDSSLWLPRARIKYLQAVTP
jgi:hypothetical protein